MITEYILLGVIVILAIANWIIHGLYNRSSTNEITLLTRLRDTANDIQEEIDALQLIHNYRNNITFGLINQIMNNPQFNRPPTPFQKILSEMSVSKANSSQGYEFKNDQLLFLQAYGTYFSENDFSFMVSVLNIMESQSKGRRIHEMIMDSYSELLKILRITNLRT